MAWTTRVGQKKAFSDEAFVRWLGDVEGHSGITSYTAESRLELEQRCGRKGCECSHRFPCEAGWIEVHDQPNRNGQLRACPRCRPDVVTLAASARDRSDFQAVVRDKERREEASSRTAWD